MRSCHLYPTGNGSLFFEQGYLSSGSWLFDLPDLPKLQNIQSTLVWCLEALDCCSAAFSLQKPMIHARSGERKTLKQQA
ncbi:hypothetical protein H6P81_018071 [Aristolochia fimbriata]|uniref:Uncharacterized protein n=1 Tax=Aristolochia fimbriata TaxID=158543 RepID=A0AAV7E321_ARIFI|nr:hypothetical protein H6P81_018071 [Aristolochia fimbriata]